VLPSTVLNENISGEAYCRGHMRQPLHDCILRSFSVKMVTLRDHFQLINPQKRVATTAGLRPSPLV